MGTIRNVKTKKVLKAYLVKGTPRVTFIFKNGRKLGKNVKWVVFKYFKKEELHPKCLILNKDFNKLNNVPKNLEQVKWGEYLRLCNENRNKIRGVYKWKTSTINPHKGFKKNYRAVLKINGKVQTLGYFETKEQAFNSYIENYFKEYGRVPFVF